MSHPSKECRKSDSEELRNGLDCTQKIHTPILSTKLSMIRTQAVRGIWQIADLLLLPPPPGTCSEVLKNLIEAEEVLQKCWPVYCKASFQWTAVKVEHQNGRMRIHKVLILPDSSPPKSSTPQNIQIFYNILCFILKDTVLSSSMSSSNFNKYKGGVIFNWMPVGLI